MAHRTRKFVVSGLTWHLAPDAAEGPLGRCLSAGRDPRELEHTVVKVNPHRRVLRVERNGAAFFVKHHFGSSPAERLRSLIVKSRAKAEWDALRRMRALGFAVPPPVAYAQGACSGEHASVIVTGELTRARNLRDALDALSADVRLELVAGLGAELRRLHEAGVYHRDMQPGNFFVEPAGGGFKFYFLDLHKACFGSRVSRRRRVKDLGQLVFNLALFCAPEEITVLLDGYAGGKASLRFVRRVNSRARKLRRIRKKSRSKRCLKNSTQFAVERVGNLRIYRRREFPVSELLRVVQKHRASGRETSAIAVVGSKYHVKQIDSTSLWQNFKDLFQRPRGRRAWHAANALTVRGIPTPEPVALVEELSRGLVKHSFLITRYIDSSETLAEYVHRNLVMRKPGPSEVDTAAKKLVEALTTLYKEGIYHSDLKASNILVETRPGAAIEFYFTDFDGIQLWRRLTPARMVKNLAQLYCSVPLCVAGPAAARFFLRFLRQAGLGPELRGRFAGITRTAEKRRQGWISVVRRYGRIR